MGTWPVFNTLLQVEEPTDAPRQPEPVEEAEAGRS